MSVDRSPRIALVSCVKRKLSRAAAARDLYTSALFIGLRHYAERHSDRWFILSAKHGLVEPSRIIEPYEQTLNKMTRHAREEWAQHVCSELDSILPKRADVLLLAGQRYREDIEKFLLKRGHTIAVPLRGLSLGRQLAWLKRANELA